MPQAYPSSSTLCTAFVGARRLASGTAGEVALAVKAAIERGENQSILIFEDATGVGVDFDLRGSPQAILARLAGAVETGDDEEAQPRGRGRPKLGVVAREVTLLPRHWDWLNAQPGGASVALRKLVEAARKSDAAHENRSAAQRAADRFMSATVGNHPGYEEAARALYARDKDRFYAQSDAWPKDLRDHARGLAAPAFDEVMP
jgi:uncharacterized protein